MRFGALWSGICLVLLSAVSAGSDDLRATPDVLAHYLNQTVTLSARFRQSVRNTRGEVVDEASGRVWLARPGRFRWLYEAPYPRVIVADGSTVWLYDEDLAQVTVRNLDSGLGETPAGLLTGAVSLETVPVHGEPLVLRDAR